MGNAKSGNWPPRKVPKLETKYRPSGIRATPAPASIGTVASFWPAGGVPTKTGTSALKVSTVAVMIADPSGPTELTIPVGLTVTTAGLLDDHVKGCRRSIS